MHISGPEISFITQTKRCGLRPFVPADAQFLYRLNGDPEVIRYTGDPPFSSIVEAHNFILQYDQFDKYRTDRWAVIRLTDNKPLGWCGLNLHPENGDYDLGFRFFKAYWNQGYATETSIAVLAYANNVLKTNKVIARARIENVASWKVLEKLNMQRQSIQQMAGHPAYLYQIVFY